ncbi:hypothetical protein SNE40_000221 [Patella caerulea]|uniref:Uncharacterized protein n=1 Tax=Patella caerulea TaxID=87958 RepID=A0AAN8KGI3_PATCE
MQRFRQERLEAAQRFREEELRFELEQEDAIQRYNQGLTSLAEIMAMQANDAASYDDTVNYALGDEGVMSRRKRSHDEDAEEDVDIGVTNQGIYAALNLGSSSTDNNNKATSGNQRQTVWARR